MIPSLAKYKTLTDFYGKFARFSLIILIVFCIPSSYPIEAIASIGGAGIFFLLGPSVSCNWQDMPEVRIVRAHWKGCSKKKECSGGFWKRQSWPRRAFSRHGFHFFFPSSGSVYLSMGGSILQIPVGSEASGHRGSNSLPIVAPSSFYPAFYSLTVHIRLILFSDALMSTSFFHRSIHPVPAPLGSIRISCIERNVCHWPRELLR